MQKRKFIVNVFIMSSSMLFIRIAGMISNIYISARAGASAMGLYSMIFSIFTFGITFASSGTGFAVTRLTAEKRANEASIVDKCLKIALFMSLIAFGVFFVGAPLLQKWFIPDKNASNAIRLLAFALPCMAVSAVYRGYFIAKRKAGLITASSTFEEGICLGTTLFFLDKYAGTSKAYLCLIYGCAVSNLFAIIFDFTSYKSLLRKSVCIPCKICLKDILSICVPVALGSYLRTALVAVENLMIPLQFAKFGTPNPVGEYGIIKAMAMSVVLFPTVFIQAFSSMLVPEMSEMNANGRKNGIRYVFSHAISAVMMFSMFISLMLICHHNIIGISFFKETKVSHYLFLLSLLAVPMYLDTVADSILKGLDLQNASLKYNIIDSFLRVVAILLFMPRYGPVFYIAMLYISEIFNLTLSIAKASKSTGLKADWLNWIILPFICAFVAFWFENPIIQTLIYVGIYYVGIKLYSKYDSI